MVNQKRLLLVQLGARVARMATDKKGITVRFEDEEMERVNELARRYNVNSTTVIRWACNALYEYVEANGGKITLPLDFSMIFEAVESKAEGERQPLALVAEKPVSYRAKKRTKK